jgi:hypothetical protein
MIKKQLITYIITAAIISAILVGLDRFVLPDFIAGQVVSQGNIKIDDYVITTIKSGTEYDHINTWKLSKLQRSWAAVPGAWPAILPVLIFGCITSWVLGRWLIVNGYKKNAETEIELNNQEVKQNEARVEKKLKQASIEKREAEKLHHDADKFFADAYKIRQEAENYKKDKAEAIARADDAERKLQKERVEHKKVHDQLVRIKEKQRGKTDPPESS